MTGVIQDISYACRLLRRRPAFTLFVVLTLAIGIGANTAVFTVVNGVLLRPLPYPESDRLVNVWGRFDPESGFDFPQFVLSGPEYLDYRNQNTTLEGVAAFTARSLTVGGPGADPERVPGVAITANLLGILRATPAIGRSFSDDEMKVDGPPAVLLSHGYWQSRFGADPAIVGRTVPLNGQPVTVVGVMPPSFAFPRPDVRMWTPLRIDPANPGGRSAHGLRAIGRLAPGVPLERAEAEMRTLMNNWKAAFPDIHTGHYLFIRPMLEDVVGQIRPALMLLLAATGFVLLIVCANVGSIVLARGEARTREMAIRGALGAERARLVRLSLIESAILAACGGLLGLLLAGAGIQALVAIDPASVPRSYELDLDYRVLAFAAAVSILSAGLFGVAPALRGSRAELQTTLRESSHAMTGGANRQVFRRGLVSVEVALTVVLVLGAGLMLRSFARLVSVEAGFRPEGLVTAGLSLPPASYREPEKVEAFYSSLLDRLRTIPGVRSVSAGSTVPMWNDAGVWDFEVEGKPAPSPGQPAWNAKAVIVRPAYFETLGVQVIAGRLFTEHDDERSQPVVIVNETMARKFFAGEDPVGRRLRIAGVDGADAWMTIVGVTSSVRTDGLDEPAAPAYHFLQSQLPRTNGDAARSLSILLRTDGDPEPAMRALRTVVRELDPALALYDVQTADAIVAQSVARPRFTVSLLALFAAVALLLGASGIYGVLAYTVARRTHEIGIRRALGAQPSRLAREVIAGGIMPVVVGLAIGLPAAYWSSRWWSSQLFEVSAADPLTYLQVTIGVLIVSLIATVVPVRRALKVSPIVALRDEG
jgi:putative ABC transport system permease protein